MELRERIALEKAVAPDRALALGAVQLCVCAAGEERWREAFTGAAVLHSSSAGVGFISLFPLAATSLSSLSSSSTSLSSFARLELYLELDYVELGPQFHVFEVHDGMVALNFADAADARTFSTNVKGLLILQKSPRQVRVAAVIDSPASPRKGNARAAPPPPVPDISSRRGGVNSSNGAPPPRPSKEPPASPKLSPKSPRKDNSSNSLLAAPVRPDSRDSGAAPLSRQSNANTGGSGAGSSSAAGQTLGKKAGILSFLKSFGKKEQQPRMEDVEISGPEGFEHRGHVGWDPNNGFDVKNLPSEWKHLFKAAGLKKKDLEDGQTAAFVMNHIADALVKQGSGGAVPAGTSAPLTSSSASVAPVSIGGGSAAPPPPPRRRDVPLPPTGRSPAASAGLSKSSGAIVLGQPASSSPPPDAHSVPSPSSSSKYRESLEAQPLTEAPPPPPVGRRSPRPGLTDSGTLGRSSGAVLPRGSAVSPPSYPAPSTSPRAAAVLPPPSPRSSAATTAEAPQYSPAVVNDAAAPPPPPPPPHASDVAAVSPRQATTFNAPPPPPPPSNDVNSVSPRPVSPPPSGGSSAGNAGGASFADQILTVKLKKAEDIRRGALPNLDEATSEGLIGSLALALKNRRGAIATPQDEAAEDSSDEWSD